MYRLGLSEIFACRLDSEAYGFFPQYLSMVEWWLVRGQESAQLLGKFSVFRNRFYSEWKVAWEGFNSQHAQTSCLVAYRLLKLSKVPSKMDLKCSFVAVSQRIVKIEDGVLVFPTRNKRKARVELVVKDLQQSALLEQIQNNYWEVGQVFLTPSWCNMPLVRYIDLTQEKDPQVQALLK